MQLTAEKEQQDASQEEHLAQIGNVDRQTARRILRKHKGDMEKAVDALLAGDRGETVWESQHRTTPEPRYTDGKTTAIAPHPSSSVIDLTGDTEEELSRAIQLSMQDDTSGPHFRPTDRAPHPDWQMVRSNVMCRSLYRMLEVFMLLDVRSLHLTLHHLRTTGFWMTLSKPAFRISTRRITKRFLCQPQ
jgi:hypothetical protein